ncbi:hypothetical protein IW261DRAFT_1570364 [Armillaria novae-zelandiae]|uniref:Uncharacterized protein n=1 Tax=Armillaria novae-zelandiae TaxID=153914 RepID=A0AA39NW82_9AGAR|nr:hypothetical protein IW261DRAFT_1570364 [Armillaria novae-zelandiae]
MSHDVAAIECYLTKDRKREPWLICSHQRRPFLQFLTDLCTDLPHAIPVVARYLALLPPGYTLFSPTPQAALFDAALPLTKIPVAARRAPDHASGWTIDSHEAKERSNLRSAPAQSQLLLSAIHDLSIRIRALGYACYLSGPGDVPWYILGNFGLAVDCRIHFVAIPVNEDSDVGCLRKLLCKEGLLVKRLGGGYVFSKRAECRVTIEQASLPPDIEMGVTIDGIPIYSPARLVFNELSEYARLADKPTKKGLEGGRKEKQLLKIISGLKAFGRAKMDLRSAIMDVEKREMFDKLVVETCASHPELTDDFAAVGFRESF